MGWQYVGLVAKVGIYLMDFFKRSPENVGLVAGCRWGGRV